MRSGDPLIKNASILFLFLLLCSSAYAQDSIFDEGVDTTIKPEDITDELRTWAQNTAVKLKKLLEEINKGSYELKRMLIVQSIQESVEEAKDKQELLLMRFTLNRALKLEEEFHNQHDALVVHHILLPAVKQAIALYEQSDLPYLQFNSGKPEAEIEPPNYAAYTKTNIGYLLNASNMNKTLEGQFNIARMSLAWVAKDILRSPKAKRNSANADIVIQLQKLLTELEPIQKDEINYKLNNKLRNTLLDLLEKIVPETSEPIPQPLTYLRQNNENIPSFNSPAEEKTALSLDDVITISQSLSTDKSKATMLNNWYSFHGANSITLPTLKKLINAFPWEQTKNDTVDNWFRFKKSSLTLNDINDLCTLELWEVTRIRIIQEWFKLNYESLSLNDVKQLMSLSPQEHVSDEMLQKWTQFNMGSSNTHPQPERNRERHDGTF